MKSYPKVLIFYQTFNSYSGGGITLTNLFLGWPKDRLAVISYPDMLIDVSLQICEKYYQLGNKEFSWIFPANLYKKSYPSGELIYQDPSPRNDNKTRIDLKHLISSYLINPVIAWVGLNHSISHLRISSDLKGWLSDYKPDILYLQLANRESIGFSIQLIDYMGVPAIIHMMDDWPLTISSYGPLKRYWRKIIDKEFRGLLDKVDLHLSISDAMSDEYFRRYRKVFKAFHNPVDLVDHNDLIDSKKLPLQRFKVLYLGRIGTANKNTISIFANHISKYRYMNIEIVFDIFSKDGGIREMAGLKQLKNVNINQPVKYELVSTVMKQYDLLLLPLDFTEEGIRFSKYSIPTKASEYMLSGTPILVFAPGETAVSQFFSKYNCGCCVNTPKEKALGNALDILIRDREYRHMISTNAYKIAREKFDGRKVRREFQGLLTATAQVLCKR